MGGKLLPLGLVIVAILAWIAFDIHAFAINGDSMEPKLESGDLVLTAEGHVGKGDVIAYRHDGMTVVHKVVNVRGDLYRTRGVNNSRMDPWLVPEENVVGKVFLKVPRIGRLLQGGIRF